MRWILRCAVVSMTVVLAGCNAGMDGFSVPGLGADQTGQLAQSVAASVGDYAILDLGSGQITYAASVPGLTTDAAWCTDRMVFRAVEASVALVGSDPTAFGAQGDETRGVAAFPRYWMGVFEVTEGQWKRLAGSEPWTAVRPQSLLGSAALGSDRDRTPAVGLSFQTATAGIAAAAQRLGRGLALPDPVQWEYACRAGATGSFAWGESRDEAVIRRHAVVGEVLDGVGGARVVGSLTANAFGFYDLHGNAWEFTSDGALRGGSWRDTLAQARCANRGPELDRETAHPLVGLRLVLVP